MGEAIVEAAAPGPGHVRENSVERDAIFFIEIEPLIKKIAQEPAILRNPFAVDTPGRRDRFRIVFGVRREIAKHRKAATGDDRIGHDVNVFVKLSCLESAVEM